MKATKKKMMEKKLLRYTQPTEKFKVGDLVYLPEDKLSLSPECIGFITNLNNNDIFDYYEVFWFDSQEYSEEMIHTLRKYDKNNK